MFIYVIYQLPYCFIDWSFLSSQADILSVCISKENFFRKRAICEISIENRICTIDKYDLNTLLCIRAYSTINSESFAKFRGTVI